MSSVFDALQLQRIAQAIEDGYAGGGTLTVDVTGAGDMQGATAGTAGVHGLVPAPQAGDEGKVLTGAGTWEDLPASGGVDYSTSEQDTGLKWIDGTSPVYQVTDVVTVSGLNVNIALSVPDNATIISQSAVAVNPNTLITELVLPYQGPYGLADGMWWWLDASGGSYTAHFRSGSNQTPNLPYTVYITSRYIKNS